MDQDFHFYGTYHAARTAKFKHNDAELIAKAANFIDFCDNINFPSDWKLITKTEKGDYKNDDGNYNVVAKNYKPRFTMQGIYRSGFTPDDSVWCAYHFLPGNYEDGDIKDKKTLTPKEVHGDGVAGNLEEFETRDVEKGREAVKNNWLGSREGDFNDKKMLTRPQSALSRRLILDTVKRVTSDEKLDEILGCATGFVMEASDNEAVQVGKDIRDRFRLILLGVRAHVIADTWAHQDHCGLSNVMNTYWDAKWKPNSEKLSEKGYGRQSINYDDGTPKSQSETAPLLGWKNQVLSMLEKQPLIAVPNGTSYLGHGWLGHLPDYSFVKFNYRPCWADPDEGPIVRDNPTQYRQAWIELVSMFTQAGTSKQLDFADKDFATALGKAESAIGSPCALDPATKVPRTNSAQAWYDVSDWPKSSPLVDVMKEPDQNAVLKGEIERSSGSIYVDVESDLYLFQIAADYHFHFVKKWLESNEIYEFSSDWAKPAIYPSALGDAKALFPTNGQTTQFDMYSPVVLTDGKEDGNDKIAEPNS